MSIAAVSVKRPIATTMVYLIVITLGLISFRFLPVDLLPPIEFRCCRCNKRATRC